MIQQPENPRTKTVALAQINKGLMQVRHLQARINGREFSGGPSWGSAVYAPSLVPLTRRIE